MKDCVIWDSNEEGPTEYQLEIAYNLVQNKRACVRGPHGLGKTMMTSLLVLWFALTRDGIEGEDWKIPTLASASRQLERFLWPEIHKWARRLDWEKIGRDPFVREKELMTYSMRLTSGEAFALTSHDPQLIEGAHADHILYIFDESKIIPDAMWDSAEGAMSTSPDAMWAAFSTPGSPVGRFYDIHKRKPGYEDWWIKHVTLQDAIYAGRIDEGWADQREKQWGTHSSIYQNRVLGEFAEEDEDVLIPLAWVEDANDRWYALNEENLFGPIMRIGVDVARLGQDKTVYAFVSGLSCVRLEKHTKELTTATSGRVVAYLTENKYADAVIDVVNIGGGVVDSAEEIYGERIKSFNGAESTDATDNGGNFKFANKRSAAWYYMRELLDPTYGLEVALPPDDELTGELTAPTYKILSGARIQVEPKLQLLKRIRKSPNCADAVVMAYFPDADSEGMDAA